MTLIFAVMQARKPNSYTIQATKDGETDEARLSGPLTNLGVDPQPGQLIAIDTSIVPPEIVHVYQNVDPVSLREADYEILASETFPDIIRRHSPPEKPAELDSESRYMSWTGLAAQVWDPSGGDEPQKDHAYLRRVIENNGGPALDVGCGTGRLLLRYLADGLDVEGIDSSADMLAFCQEKANQQGLPAKLFQQSMHELDLPRKYRTIFIPCGTFCLLINRKDAVQALDRFYEHLEPRGELIFNLFWEYGKGGWFWNEPNGKWYRMFYSNLPNGDQVFQYMKTEKVDRVEQQFFGKRRYRLVSRGQVIREEIFPSYERVYGKYEIQMMLEQAGFREVTIKGDWTEEPFRDGHEVMVIHGRK
jgi:SAM-dependent methyltransferase